MNTFNQLTKHFYELGVIYATDIVSGHDQLLYTKVAPLSQWEHSAFLMNNIAVLPVTSNNPDYKRNALVGTSNIRGGLFMNYYTTCVTETFNKIYQWNTSGVNPNIIRHILAVHESRISSETLEHMSIQELQTIGLSDTTRFAELYVRKQCQLYLLTKSTEDDIITSNTSSISALDSLS